jgi:hypothetical protein
LRGGPHKGPVTSLGNKAFDVTLKSCLISLGNFRFLFSVLRSESYSPSFNEWNIRRARYRPIGQLLQNQSDPCRISCWEPVVFDSLPLPVSETQQLFGRTNAQSRGGAKSYHWSLARRLEHQHVAVDAVQYPLWLLPTAGLHKFST